jgi:hypothetical protein
MLPPAEGRLSSRQEWEEKEMVAMDGLDTFSGSTTGSYQTACRVGAIGGAHQPRLQHQKPVVHSGWARKTGQIHLGNGGYGWTRTTDLSIMSAAL